MFPGLGSQCSLGTRTPANSTEPSPCGAAGKGGAGRDGGCIPRSSPAREEKSCCKTRRKNLGLFAAAWSLVGRGAELHPRRDGEPPASARPPTSSALA